MRHTHQGLKCLPGVSLDQGSMLRLQPRLHSRPGPAACEREVQGQRMAAMRMHAWERCSILLPVLHATYQVIDCEWWGCIRLLQ
jgi:hypothetical protein